MTPAPAPIPAGALGAGNPMAGEPGAEGAIVPVADDGMEFLVGALVRIGGFALDAPDIGQGVATATRTRSQHYGFRASNTERLTCRWCPDPGDPARSLLAWVVKDSAHHPLAADTHVIGTRYLPAALQSFLDREQGW
ncbi:MAG: hypothetical protein QOE27_1844, partial [Solirubrobacteraceae bacterium]|nr:hypothetical protein [Solirubrobacteraceae bacterium]